MAKYNDLTELAAAFKSGELDKNEWMLVIDNDSDWLQWLGEIPFEDPDDIESKMYKKAHELYSGGDGSTSSGMIGACRAAGIPTEGC